jgi:hypothetical protein
MKYILIFFFSLIINNLTAQRMNREIIDVSESNSGFRITFESGNRIYCNKYSGCNLLGFNSDYFVVEDYNHYLILTPACEVNGHIQTISGKVHRVTSNSIIVRDGDYLKTYDMRGNFKGSRQVF